MEAYECAETQGVRRCRTPETCRVNSSTTPQPHLRQLLHVLLHADAGPLQGLRHQALHAHGPQLHQQPALPGQDHHLARNVHACGKGRSIALLR